MSNSSSRFLLHSSLSRAAGLAFVALLATSLTACGPADSSDGPPTTADRVKQELTEDLSLLGRKAADALKALKESAKLTPEEAMLVQRKVEAARKKLAAAGKTATEEGGEAAAAAAQESERVYQALMAEMKEALDSEKFKNFKECSRELVGLDK